ncbi:MAG: prepilin-type N-terminal cleavage/methylation domain-containing protein, partial [Planctomycetota bacterium]
MRMTSTMATMMGHRNRAAFTLVELLMAMTITLLLMAALGKSFAVIGKTMKEGRSQVSLSSKLRGVSFRLRTDLRSMTVKAQPPLKSQSGGGYFTYYEGPLTEHTFGLYGAKPFQETTTGSVVGFGDPGYGNIDNGPTYREHSRQGDFDDYIAFTAEAPGDDWFTGKVPAYLVDDTVDVNGNGTLDPAEQVAAMEPRVIRSKYAEIIIWASPDYQVWDVDPNAAGTYPDTNDIRLADHPLAMPLYADSDQDYVPDRIRLHQRILLIRPDLNSRLRVGTGASAFESPLLRPLLNDTVNPGLVPTALQRIYPIGNTLYPNYAHPTSATDNRFLMQSNWLVGMAPLHHFFDLSLRRVFHPQTGDPTNYVAANSLEDLVQPHNRFAHVRYPGRYFGRGTFGTVNSASDNA